MRRRSVVLILVGGLCAQGCKESSGTDDDSSMMMGAAGTPAMTAGQSGAAAGSGGVAGSMPMTMQPAGSSAAGTGGTTAAAGMGGMAGSTPSMMDSGVADAASDADTTGDATTDSGGGPLDYAAELHELFIHDACTGEYPPQPDTCIHELNVERVITFGGTSGSYDVTLRVRGLFEPTTINGGQTPDAQHPYFKVGGTVAAADYSNWHIRVSNPQQTYWLNHYPSTSHTIYKEDFEATITVEAGAQITVGATDGNDRQIDNAEEGPPDRRQLIEGVTDEVLDGQVLRLDVISVEPS